MGMVGFERSEVLPEPGLPDPAEIRDTGRRMARQWPLQDNAFLKASRCTCELQYKQRMVDRGRIMKHAHMGFRSKQKSIRAYAEIHEGLFKKGLTLDRYGICLDWSMGFPRHMRAGQTQGTGLILDETEDFVELVNSAPVAAHFGDFMLGFPAALENTCSALSAGVTVIGNLGQYFTFTLPGWKDEVETTRSTLTAIALMVGQDADILVHSNLDDGFAAVFEDVSCMLGAAMVERYLVEDLMGGRVAHCFGHHFSSPLLRYAFLLALAEVSPGPGSMIYGNTTSYGGTDAENFASLSAYLRVDVAAQKACPTGHALNPVPVTENRRIPDIQEILDAHLFAGRLCDLEEGLMPPVDPDTARQLGRRLVDGAQAFYDNLLNGFGESGIDTGNPVEMFLAIRRLGGRRLENWYGPGRPDKLLGRRVPVVMSDTVREIDQAASVQIRHAREAGADRLREMKLKLVVATTDVHEHSKRLLEQVFSSLGLAVVDGGISVDPDELSGIAESSGADVIALCTYNGVALAYFERLRDELKERGMNLPVLVGGQLNQIPRDTQSSLPVDVTQELRDRGAIVCPSLVDAVPALCTYFEHRRPGGRH